MKNILRRNFLKKTTGAIGLVALGSIMSRAAVKVSDLTFSYQTGSIDRQSGHETKSYGVSLSTDKPEFTDFWLDSLLNGRACPGGIESNKLQQKYKAATQNGWISYYPIGQKDAKTSFKFDDQSVLILSEAGNDHAIEPFVLKFTHKGPNPAFATLLGQIEEDGSVKLPAVLHIPGQGTMRITAKSAKNIPLKLGYEGVRDWDLDQRFGKIIFPAASEKCNWIEFKLEVIQVYPKIAAIEGDARFDGYRRCWLNILQLSAEHRMLANHVSSDVCGLVYHEYSEIASLTGEMADGVSGLQILRDSLNRFLDDGKIAYAMGIYKGDLSYPEASLDTWPSLLIAAYNYYRASNDQQWVQRQIDKLINWGNQSLATDKNGNGLIKYHQSGNAGDCNYRPANWWDAINFGHEDAYSNALAYRAFQGLSKMAWMAGRNDDATKFDQAAQKIKSAYFKTFYNPETGMLAGWKSRDGELHDYAFLFIQGMAITFGLIDDDKVANKLLDTTIKKMKEVGYDRFDLGLPGNLIAIPPEDYFFKLKQPSWDQIRHPFQVYENGGVSANHSYYLLTALYKLGRIEEGDRFLLPILKGFNDGSFQGYNELDKSYDWRSWDGKAHGYEGILVDNFLAVKAVLVRQGLVDPESGYWKKS